MENATVTRKHAPHLLLIPGESTERVSSAELISDLKLDTLLPDECNRFLLMKPNENGFLSRRELFSSLLHRGSGAVSALRNMLSLLTEANDIHSALCKAESDSGRVFLFTQLSEVLIRFYEAAASERIADGELYSRFREFFANEYESESFRSLKSRSEALSSSARAVSSLTLDTDGETVKVSRSTERSLRNTLSECLDKYGFSPKSSRARAPEIQKSLIDAAAKLYPSEFADFTAFYAEKNDAFPEGLFDLIPEISAILGILSLTERAASAGIPYCFPTLTKEQTFELSELYDAALLEKEGTKIVPNDVLFDKSAPFFYLTGANGGGKTTYLRAVGAAATLFCFGAPVFCRSGKACLLSSVQTHFPKDERFEGSGRFADEERRVNEILKSALLQACDTSTSAPALVLLNETYSTTNEEKAIRHTAALADKLYDGGCFGLYITHQHAVNERRIPFLGVLVDESDENRRTYRIERRRLSNRSFAADILIKHGITREQLSKKLASRKA